MSPTRTETARRDSRDEQPPDDGARDAPHDLPPPPPHNAAAEQAVIGACILDPRALILIDGAVEPEHFYFDRHKVLFATLQAMGRAKQPIDPLTIEEQLARDGTLDLVGGADVLLAIRDSTPSAANVGYYADIVRRDAARRRMILASHVVRTQAYDPSVDVDDTLDAAEQEIIEARVAQVSQAPTVADLIAARWEVVGEASADILARGIPTGIGTLDEIMTMQPGALWITVAATGRGKSTFAMNVAQHVAMTVAEPVLFYSLETPAADIARRVIAMRAGLPSRPPKRKAEADEYRRKWEAAVLEATSTGNRLRIDDQSGLTVSKICAGIARAAMTNQCRVAVIDYLQLVQVPPKMAQTMTRDEQLTHIARRILETCRSYNVTGLLLAQAKTLANADAMPTVEDIAGSRGPGQDAAVILSLWNDGQRDRLKVLKNRQAGGGREVAIEFDKETGRITEGNPRKQRARDAEFEQKDIPF